MRALLAAPLLMLATAGLAATVTWRWVDQDGVHYSDQQHEGAERIVLGEIQTYTPAPVAQPPGPARRAAAAPDFKYESCEISRPTNDEVLFESQSVTVTVATNPSPRAGDRISLVFDGKLIDGQGGQAQFRISPIDRGEHSASVVLHDASGRQMCQSRSVTFYVRQPSLLSPGRPGKH
jgi:hypothetical protein